MLPKSMRVSSWKGAEAYTADWELLAERLEKRDVKIDSFPEQERLLVALGLF